MLLNRRHSERGAVAVIVAMCTLLMFGIGALAIDLANAFARERSVQAQADFAALAGGAELTGGEAPGSESASDPAVLAVVDYLNKNQPQDDDRNYATELVTPTQMVDHNLANGEVQYLVGNQMRVVAPQAQVKFGLAGAMGFEKTEVSKAATVGLKSPGTGIMPVFAVDGCDYGSHLITDPANLPPPSVPTDLLDNVGPFNDAEVDKLTPDVAEKSETLTVNIQGKKLGTVTKVGFYRSSALTPNKIEIVVDPADWSANKGEVDVNFGVTDYEGVWWVRVFKPDGPPNTDPSIGTWSPAATAQPFRVGSGILECAGKTAGNFGTLKLARSTGSTSEWLPKNIAIGLEPPLSLAEHPAPNAGPGPGECYIDVPPSVYTATTGSAVLLPQTNCIDTDTGLTSNTATQGLLEGGVGYSGRLKQPETASCGNGTMTVPSHGTINNDILTCFLTDTTTTLGSIAQDNGVYGLPEGAEWDGAFAKLHSDVYKTPRFMWIPVLSVNPDRGGSNHYAIVSFRPAFLTGQSLLASKNSKWAGASAADQSSNGVYMKGSKVESLRVIFFDIDALPAGDDGTPVMPYIGSGPKLVRLIG